MLNSIWADVRSTFRYGNMVTRLIFLNVGVFVLINLVRLILFLANQGQLPEVYHDLVHFFCMSKDGMFVLTHPWVVLTSMFVHTDFWHILWNMLFLFWFGRILGDLLGDRHILPVYILGGIAGGVAYFLSANFFLFDHIGSFALGASAAVMAIVVAAGVTSPDYMIHLILIGAVRLKYIVAVLVFLDMIGIAGYNNTGGHFAHLGGAFLGWLYVAQARRGHDWSKPVNRIVDAVHGFFDRMLNPAGPKPKVAYRNPNLKKRASKNKETTSSQDRSYQEQLDAILDKIKDTGYNSLTEEEKEFLFNASKQQ